MDILNQIQEDILNQAIPLSVTLRKAKVLAYEIQSEELSNWVSQELDGYKNRSELPDYRILRTTCFGKWTNGYWMVNTQPVPIYKLKDEKLIEFLTTYHVYDGIRSIENLAFGEKQHYFISPDIISVVNHYIGERGYGYIEIEYAISSRDFEQILDTVKNRLLDFVLKLGKDWHIPNEIPSNDLLKNLISVVIYNNPQGGNVSTFDQRGQHVNYQYNAAGDININAVQSKDELVIELEKLQSEIEHAREANVISKEVAIEAEFDLLKATQEAKKAEPSKETFFDYIGKAKALFNDIAAVAGLITALMQAAEVANRLFH
jgi:antitoxin component HigA of HigAB toxin-antitoxin module